MHRKEGDAFLFERLREVHLGWLPVNHARHHLQGGGVDYKAISAKRLV